MSDPGHGNSAQIAAALIAAVALAVATAGWALNRLIFRTSFRPVVRPVPLFNGGAVMLTSFVLKNYGKGSAFTVLLYTDLAVFEDSSPMTVISVVEPLGGGSTEASRLGRVRVDLPPGLSLNLGRRYRVLYQDLEGRFHETSLTVSATGQFEVKFLGPNLVERIPKGAVTFAAIVPPEQPD